MRGEEGVWTTFARMITLRTPKHVCGPDLGIGSPYAASLVPGPLRRDRPGRSLGKIPRERWQDYLNWYRHVLDLPVRNETAIVAIEPRGNLLAATTDSGEVLLARKIVLATGISGSGAWHIPDFIENNLPRTRWGHTSEAIDFQALAGQAPSACWEPAASAFDNAATALEAGAARVQLCVRRKRLPPCEPLSLDGIRGIPRAIRRPAPTSCAGASWRHIFTMNQPPPPDTVARCAAFPQFSAHPGTPWTGARMDGDEIRIATPVGELPFDYVIIGAGFVLDPSRRLELRAFAPFIAKWGDRFTPPPGEEDGHPGISIPISRGSFAFTEREPGQRPGARQPAQLHLRRDAEHGPVPAPPSVV